MMPCAGGGLLDLKTVSTSTSATSSTASTPAVSEAAMVRRLAGFGSCLPPYTALV